jgi:hypothetical protein
MKKRMILVAGATLTAAALQAQNSPAWVATPFQQNGWVRFSDWTAVPSHTNRPDGQTGPIVGRPFSGTEVRTTVQVLADGTNVKHSDTSTFYRDSQGRMRSESPSNALIYDSLGGVVYTIDLQRKTYHKSRMQGASVTVTIAAVGNRTSVSSSSSSSTTTHGTAQPHGALTPQKTASNTRGNTVPAVTEDLPAQVINGIFAKGTRITSTIPAGTFGNDRDVKIVSERWYSDDLQVLVKTSNSDPRFGTTTYELTNVLQAPPDPLLFQPPSDFSLTSAENDFHAKPVKEQ